MPGIDVKPVTESGIEMKAEGNTIIFAGSINHLRPQTFMEPFITQIHNSIVKNNIKEVNLDMIFVSSIHPGSGKLSIGY